MAPQQILFAKMVHCSDRPANPLRVATGADAISSSKHFDPVMSENLNEVGFLGLAIVIDEQG